MERRRAASARPKRASERLTSLRQQPIWASSTAWAVGAVSLVLLVLLTFAFMVGTGRPWYTAQPAAAWYHSLWVFWILSGVVCLVVPPAAAVAVALDPRRGGALGVLAAALLLNAVWIGVYLFGEHTVGGVVAVAGWGLAALAWVAYLAWMAWILRRVDVALAWIGAAGYGAWVLYVATLTGYATFTPDQGTVLEFATEAAEAEDEGRPNGNETAR